MPRQPEPQAEGKSCGRPGLFSFLKLRGPVGLGRSEVEAHQVARRVEVDGPAGRGYLL